jgi:hypothetical protein
MQAELDEWRLATLPGHEAADLTVPLTRPDRTCGGNTCTKTSRFSSTRDFRVMDRSGIATFWPEIYQIL